MHPPRYSFSALPVRSHFICETREGKEIRFYDNTLTYKVVKFYDADIKKNFPRTGLAAET